MENESDEMDLVCAACAAVFGTDDLFVDDDGFRCPECGSSEVITPDEWDAAL